MSEHGSRFWELFFEVYENFPRQGPGNRDCASSALRLCAGPPRAPMNVDLGCGVGEQRLDLADLTIGSIVAVDSHAPSIERLRATLAARGLSHRVQAQVGDMAYPDL
jgi:ubiquinone/menaquinone biosynthesis C-methylase UbiE